MRYSTLALKLEDAFREKAKANLEKGGQLRELLNRPLANLPNPKTKEIIPVNTRAEVAKIAGFMHVS